jgi:hypothetical protein
MTIEGSPFASDIPKTDSYPRLRKPNTNPDEASSQHKTNDENGWEQLLQMKEFLDMEVDDEETTQRYETSPSRVLMYEKVTPKAKDQWEPHDLGDDDLHTLSHSTPTTTDTSPITETITDDLGSPQDNRVISTDSTNETIPQPTPNKPKEPAKEEQPVRNKPEVKQVKGRLGKKEDFVSFYDMEKEHTLSGPLDLEAVLREANISPQEAKKHKHIAASFNLSNTLQELSFKDVPDLPPEQPQTAKPAIEGEAKANDDATGDTSQDDEKALPSWLFWGLGMLLWAGVALLIWKIVSAGG